MRVVPHRGVVVRGLVLIARVGMHEWRLVLLLLGEVGVVDEIVVRNVGVVGVVHGQVLSFESAVGLIMVWLGLLGRLLVLVQEGIETDHSFARFVGHTAHLGVICELFIFCRVYSWDCLYWLLSYNHRMLLTWGLLGAHVEVKVQQTDFSLGFGREGFRLFGNRELNGGRLG